MPPVNKPKPTRQVKRAAARRAAKSPAAPPAEPEGAPVEEGEQINGVLVKRGFTEEGKIVCNVVALGDVKASELEYILRRGLKAIAEADL